MSEYVNNFNDWSIVTSTEGPSSEMVAFRFVRKSMSALSMKSNMGDQSYQRQLEEFEVLLTEILSNDREAVDYVAGCLSQSYKQAVSEPVLLAEDLCSDIVRIAVRLHLHAEELQHVLVGHGRHGNILATYLGKGQTECRAFI